MRHHLELLTKLPISDFRLSARSPPPGPPVRYHRRTLTMCSDRPATETLLDLIRAGDEEARERLLERYLGPLQRWAHARLPVYARGAVDTDDLVQVTFLRALNRLDRFEPLHEGAFLAYLRRILANSIRDEVRRSIRRPDETEIPASLPDRDATPLERVIGRQRVARYEKALASLPETQQHAVILRLELGLSHREVAEALGSPSAAAARMVVVRAVERLAADLGEADDG